MQKSILHQNESTEGVAKLASELKRALSAWIWTLLTSLLLSACSSPSSWSINTIANGDKTFDFSRLRYSSSQAHPNLAFEIIKIGNQIEAFIHLTRFRFTSPDEVTVQFTIAGDSFEDTIPVHEGAMRVRLLPETTRRLIHALQEGDEVAIIADGFEETLTPKQFTGSFAKFVGEGH